MPVHVRSPTQAAMAPLPARTAAARAAGLAAAKAAAPGPTADPAQQLRRWVLGYGLATVLGAVVAGAWGVAMQRQVRRLARRTASLQRRLALLRAAHRRVRHRRRAQSGGAWSGERLGLVATLCHEIRTPMHAVIGILELLLHKTAIRGEARHYIGTAHECARSLITLVGDVLDMARLEAGRLEIRPEPVQLSSLLRQLVQTFRPLAATHRLRIRLRLGLLRGRQHQADPQRLRQVVGNLLSNAIKYSGQGEITVKLESTGETGNGESIRIVVQDHGPGIDAQQMPRLFEPFVRGGGERGSAGTGLGLSISRQLVRQMGGELAVASHPGAGTTATVALDLPCVASRGPAAHDKTDPAPPTPVCAPLRTGFRALVVEDHPAGRMLLARQLGHLGVDAVCAADSRAAMALYEAGEVSIDIVITDCNMPGLDGFELARRLRAYEGASARPRVPILGYSADAREQNRERALAAGMDDCLFKPIDLDSLAQVLRHWLAAEPYCPPAEAPPAGRDALVPSADTEAAIRAALRAGNTADLAALRSAFAVQDWSAMCTVAHRLKGVARMTACQAAAACCEAIESASTTGDLAAAGEAIEDLALAIDGMESLRLTAAHAAKP